MTNLYLLYPEGALSVLAILLLLADLFVPNGKKRVLYFLGLAACTTVLFLVCFSILNPLSTQGVGTLWAADPFAQFFKMLILLTTLFCLMMTLDYKSLTAKHSGTFTSLILFSASGLMFLVSSIDLLLTFVALELVSISSFVLAGYERRNPKSNEGAIKYFIFGAFSSAVMAFGISLFYGAVGTTRLAGVIPSSGPTFVLGILLILLGFAFKASLAPMHFWVPDAYEGAPTPITTFLSIAPKIATLGAMMRLFHETLPLSMVNLTTVFTIMAALTMTIGNFTAFFQTNMKRLLAYSSIAQAGYILIALVANNDMGMRAVMLYSFLYIAMNIGAFAIVQAVAMQSETKDPYDINALNGLGKRSFGLALCMFFFVLSLAGIPPLAGFIGKFYIFSSAVQTGFYGLAVIGLINSVVSVYYYLRIVYHMFFLPSTTQEPLSVGVYLFSGLALAAVAVIIFGVYPEPLLASIQASAFYLP